jgi:hypothetical protein
VNDKNKGDKMKQGTICLLFALFIFNIAFATSSGLSVNSGVPWPGTDALGRELPMEQDVGPLRKDRFVGIFYLTWLGDEFSYGPYDVTKIITEFPEALTSTDFPGWGPKTWHMVYRGEPLFGYYNGRDPWVIRRHMQMLADAGVDVLMVDATNAEMYEKVVEELFTTMEKIRSEGGQTPQVAFICATKGNEIVAQLMEKIYRKGRFRDLWFHWEGKPLLLIHPEAVGASTPQKAAGPEAAEFFTLRGVFWPGLPPYNNTSNAWHWMATYPQPYSFMGDPEKPEQISVSPAQNLHWKTGAITMMARGDARGRGFHDGRQDPSIDAVQEGKNFQEQWNHALKTDPKFLFITAWNEWIAGMTRSLRDPWVQCDGFNEEFSRDIEPMKGGHGDNFYMQSIANIRRYKGAPALPKATGQKTIRMDGGFDQWNDVGPVFSGRAGNTLPRDFLSFGCDKTTRITVPSPIPTPEYHGQDAIRYTNNTGRNGLLEMKVSRDTENIYFYVKTEKPISPSTDPNWMMLFIRTGNPTHHDWNGYDYVLNRLPPVNGNAVLEKNNGGWNWLKAGPMVRFKVEGNEFHVAIPRRVLGLEKDPVTFDFKWMDNVQLPDDLTVLYVEGDTAPVGRLRFRYIAD